MTIEPQREDGEPAPERPRVIRPAKSTRGSAAGPAARSPSLSIQIYEQLREGIIRGRYPQGSRLIEAPLAQELDVSRVPLREAIPRLVVDGFVHTEPQRGMVVMTWSTRSAHELFDLRLCLEVGATRYAARQARAGASMQPLIDVLESSHAGVDSGDPYRIAHDSAVFHEMIVRLTGNGLMRSVMESVIGRMMWLFYLTSELDPGAALHEHEDLLSAISSGNEGLAEAVAYAHIEHDRDESMRVLERHGIH